MKNLRSTPIAARLLACLLLLVLAAPSSPPSTAAQPRAAAPLLIDINPGSASSYPGGLVTVGDLIYFSADDGTHGHELWRTDGTTAGTWMVKDITPGAAGTAVDRVTPINGTLFFLVYTGTAGTSGTVDLWRTDGTAAGTSLVEAVGAWSSLDGCSFSISPFGENIVIAKSMKTTKPCDGSVSIHSGVSGGTLWSKAGERSETATLAGRSYFFFTSQDASAPSGLWASTDTAPGIAYVDPLPTDGWIDQVRTSAGAFYFISHKPDNRGIPKSTLWKSTGAPGGISMVKEFPTDRFITSSAVFSDSLIFLVAGVYLTDTNELWRSDGTPAGTQSIRLLASAPRGVGLNWQSSRFVRVGDRLAFDGPASCNPEVDSYTSLWTTDGSPSGTGLVTLGLRLIDPTEPSISYETPMVEYGDRIVFFAKNDSHGVEPWISDGTTAGTRLLADLTPGAGGSENKRLATLPGKILVTAENPSSGLELWVIDASAPPPVPAAGPHRLYLPLAAHTPTLLCSTP